MSLNTNLNVAPFYNDYLASKNYYIILFRPEVPIQARELTQIQSILQNQIAEFGSSVHEDGTVIKGCTFSFDSNYYYAKILDLQIDGEPVNVDAYANSIIKNSANVTATCVNVEAGLQSQNPDLNTVYLKYLNTGTDGSSTFLPGQVLSIYAKDYHIQNLSIQSAGIGYSNSDSVLFSSNVGSGASARILTDNLGVITNIILTTQGNGYLNSPVISIANSTGGTSNGFGAAIIATNQIAQVTVAGNTFNSGANADFNTVGTGYSMFINDGTVYHKGYFINVGPQSVVVSKYDTAPNGVTVGLVTNELVVNNNVDTSLLDNAQGYDNYTAPGAYRLKIDPVLTVVNTASVADSNNFFSLVSFVNGSPVQNKQNSKFNNTENQLAARTRESSGNFVVSPFTIITDDIAANTTHFNARVSTGSAYVDGYRIQQYVNTNVPVRKGIDSRQVDNVGITPLYGNFLYINNLQGDLPYNQAVDMSIRNAVSNGTGAATGTEIGVLRLRGLTYDSAGAGSSSDTYRLYVFRIRLNAGHSITEARSLFYNGGGSPNNGVADIILNNGVAVVQAPATNNLIFPNGRNATTSYTTLNNQNKTVLNYATVDPSVSFNTSGILQKNLTGNETYANTGTLSTTQEQGFVLVARNSANSATNGAGTIAAIAGNSTFVGSGTSFLSYYNVGDWIALGSGDVRRIINIADNATILVNAPASVTANNVAHVLTFPVDQPVKIAGDVGRSMVVTNQSLVVNLNTTLTNALNVTLSYNVKRTGASPSLKIYNPLSYTKINIANNSSGTTGPWCLGVPDTIKLLKVLKSTTPDYISGATDVTSEFMLYPQQSLAVQAPTLLQQKATSTLKLTTNDRLLVSFSCFTHTNTNGGTNFYTVDSYPIDDSTTANNQTTIKTQDIPTFTNYFTNTLLELRDCIDFRMIYANTAAITSNAAAATINPVYAETVTTTEAYWPAPNMQFTTSLRYYLGRYDKLVVNSLGQYQVIEGVATENPYPPVDVDGAMTIATINVAPYPSLTSKSGSVAQKPNLTVSTIPNQSKNYSMAAIGDIDKRLQEVEYYTALNLLEQQTANEIVLDSQGNERFKNGFFVDSFVDFTAANVIDAEYTAAIDEAQGQLIPRFTQNKFDLQVSTSNNVAVTSNVATLAYNSVAMITQPYATSSRNCSQKFWEFTGKVFLSPNYDSFFETRTAPVPVSTDIDLAVPILSLVNNLNNIRPINQTTVVDNTSTANTNTVAGAVVSIGYTPSTGDADSVSAAYTFTGSTSLSKHPVGDFVTDATFQPYVREMPLRFNAIGLKPGSPLWVFLDDKPVSQYVQSANNTVRSNVIGSQLISDSNGVCSGSIFIPKNTFFVGSLKFIIMDVNDISLSHYATTKATAIYHAYNHSVRNQSEVISTRPVDIRVDTANNNSTTSSKTTTGVPSLVPIGSPQNYNSVVTNVQNPDGSYSTSVNGNVSNTYTVVYGAQSPSTVLAQSNTPVIVNAPLVIVPPTTVVLTPNTANVNFTSINAQTNTSANTIYSNNAVNILSGMSQPIQLGFVLSNTSAFSTGEHRTTIIDVNYTDPSGANGHAYLFQPTTSGDSYTDPNWIVNGDHRYANVAAADQKTTITVAPNSTLWFGSQVSAFGNSVTQSGSFGASGNLASILSTQISIVNITAGNTVLGNFTVNIGATSPTYTANTSASGQSLGSGVGNNAPATNIQTYS